MWRYWVNQICFSMFAVIYGMPLLNKNFINKVRLILELLMNIGMIITLETKVLVRDLSEISRGGGGGQTFLSLKKGRGHEKWAVKRGTVMQIYARDHLEVHPQKKKEVLYLAKKERKTTVYGKLLDINCEVL